MTQHYHLKQHVPQDANVTIKRIFSTISCPQFFFHNYKKTNGLM